MTSGNGGTPHDGPGDAGTGPDVISSSPLAPANGRFERLRRTVRPFRRLLAWSALVYEEQSLRVEGVQESHDELALEILRLRGELDDARQRLSGEVIAAEARAAKRMELLIEELWLRSESADARQATHIQHIAGEVRRIMRENASILHLAAGHKREITLETDISVREPGSAIDTGTIFQELERGSREEIIEQFTRYVVHFRGRSPVVDLGCGRCEFLELADWVGVTAYGVDIDPEAAATGRRLGLDVRVADLCDHLEGLEPSSLGGIFCAQVVEHLHPDVLPRLMTLAARALQTGGVILIETPNPSTLATHVQSFWRDATHLRPVPPTALAFAARSAGLVVERVDYSSFPPDDDRLQHILVEPEDGDLLAVVKSLNSMTDQLNELLYGPQDYALVATKPEPAG